MHDRLIVAEALIHRAALVTRDEAVRESGAVPVVSKQWQQHLESRSGGPLLTRFQGHTYVIYLDSATLGCE